LFLFVDVLKQNCHSKPSWCPLYPSTSTET